MQTIDLVHYLHEHGTTPADELARVFGASVRTVRAHVHEANLALEGMARVVFSRASRGYRLAVTDAPAFDAWLARAMGLAGRTTRSAADERVIYLLNNLLARTDWITIADLAAMLYVSPQSISGDLKQVEEELAPFGLTLTKRPRYGVRVEGPEMARRLCLASIVSRSLAENGQLVDDVTSEELAETTQMVSTTIDEIVREEDFAINSISFQNLVIHVVVALGRIRANALVPMDEQSLAALRDAAEYPLARRIAAAIGHKAGIEMPETETAYIAIHLAGKKTLALVAGSSSSDSASSGDSSVIPESIWSLVGEMLDHVWESFRFDLRDDLELRMNLARHLVPLTARLEYHLRIENPILADIKSRFPLAYAMAVDASSVLTERYNASMSEEELGYIALAFALALDRLKTEAPKLNVLVVCVSGAGTTRLLKQTIIRQFGDRIGSVRVCDAFHVADQDFSHIDYVFTTVPIEAPIPVPVQEINVFLDAGDVRSINELISRSAHSADLLGRIFSPELFFPHLAATTRDEALRTLAQRVVEVEGVDPSLVDFVFERERTAATAFGNGIALPHPIRPLAATTRVCVGLLDEPIDWGGRPVRLIMLVALGTEDPEALDFFFTGAANLISDEANIARILHDRTFTALTDAFATSAHSSLS